MILPISFARLAASRGGATGAMVAIMLPALLATAGFGIDGARLYAARSQLQTAADAAALAAARAAANDRASQAQAIAAANLPAAKYGEVLKPADIVPGTWSAASRSFTAGGASPNAVRVTTRRAQANQNELQLIFGAFVGIDSFDVDANAIALTRSTAACNDKFVFNSNAQPTGTKIVTQGETDKVNGKATYLQTPDRHPIVRLDNSAAGPATVVIRIQGAPGGTFDQTFYPPSRGSFKTVIESITNIDDDDTNGDGADDRDDGLKEMTLVFTTVSVSAGTKGGGTSTWASNLRTKPLEGGCVPVAGTGGITRSQLVG